MHCVKQRGGGAQEKCCCWSQSTGKWDGEWKVDAFLFGYVGGRLEFFLIMILSVFFINMSPRRTNNFFHHADLSHFTLLGQPGIKEMFCVSKYIGELAVVIYWFSRLLSPLAKKGKMLMLPCFKRLSASVCQSNWRIKMLLYVKFRTWI